MADGSRSIRRPAETPSKSPGVDAGPPRQILPALTIPPGVMVVSTQSGTAAIVTATPSPSTGIHPSLLTDPRTFTIPLTATAFPSTTPAPTQSQPASSTPTASSSPSPSHRLSTAKLAAVIVVPLVLLATLSPIIIVFYIGWRRKRRLGKRRSDRSTKSLIEHYHGTAGASRPSYKRAASNPPPRRPKNPHRIVSVPTPTFSSFNFEFSRTASIRPIRSSNEEPVNRIIPRNRRSATLSWDAPPPYTSPIRPTYSSSPIPRLDTPDIPSSPLLETAQMVHLRPMSGQQPQLLRSNSRRPAAAQSSRSIARSYDPQQEDRDTWLQSPDPARTRQESADSAAESLHHRSTLQRPFSVQGLASPTFSDVSGLSFDPRLWASSPYGRGSIVSPIDDEDEPEQTRSHQVV
ncbi:MAG: hypothetical protein Q9166_004203 [cf. Caloplaca sp. 2 TL-2023]